jgi:hypothetical protein
MNTDWIKDILLFESWIYIRLSHDVSAIDAKKLALNEALLWYEEVT